MGHFPGPYGLVSFYSFKFVIFYFQRSRISCEGEVMSPATSEDGATRRSSSEVIIFFYNYNIYFRFWDRPCRMRISLLLLLLLRSRKFNYIA